jgi:hypothetical protein
MTRKPAVTTEPRARASREIHLDQLLGRPVLAGNNQTIGRLEEFRLDDERNAPEIVEYVIGAAGLAERLGVGVGLLFGRHGRGYIARWDQLDVSDPRHPRLTCSINDLRRE